MVSYLGRGTNLPLQDVSKRPDQLHMFASLKPIKGHVAGTSTKFLLHIFHRVHLQYYIIQPFSI